jgi:hypothetical protein
VSHGQGDLLLLLLRDLNAIPSLRGARVLVTLNVPGDRIDALAYPHLDLATVSNRVPQGFAANHNAAFRQCTTEWFAVLNPDLRVEGDPFTSLLGTGKADPNLGVVAPVVINASGGLEDSVRSNLTPWCIVRRALGRERSHRTRASPDVLGAFRWFAGMFLLFRSSAFRAVQGFDERFFLYCEDYDICARLHLAGCSLKLDPYSTVVHSAQRNSHRSLRHLRWHVQSLVRVWMSRPCWQIALE